MNCPPRCRGPRARLERTGGFTLMEVMVTIAILTTLTLSSMLAIVPVAKQSRLNKEVDIATSAARRVLEKVSSTPFFEVTTLYPDGSTIPIAALQNGLVTVGYADADADPLFVQVTLSWQGQDGGVYTRDFFTVRTE